MTTTAKTYDNFEVGKLQKLNQRFCAIGWIRITRIISFDEIDYNQYF